jgi:hypothetical protein
MKKRRYQKFTEAEVQTLIHLSKQGYNNDFIAKVLKRKPSQVAQKKWGLGVKQDLSQRTEPRVKRKGRWSAREILILNHMWYKKNRPVDEIVSELGRSEKSILSKIEQLDQKGGEANVTGLWQYMCKKIGI